MIFNDNFLETITHKTDEEKLVIVPNHARLCVNCKYMVFDAYDIKSYCSVYVDAVTGNSVLCSIARGDFQYCGPTGEVYEPK